MAYNQEWDSEGAYIKYFDTLTKHDLIESNGLLVGNQEFESIKYIISDFSDITNVEIGDKDVVVSTSFSVTANSYNRYIKVALVSNNAHLQPLVEKYIEDTKNILPHAQLKHFSNMKEAQIWATS